MYSVKRNTGMLPCVCVQTVKEEWRGDGEEKRVESAYEIPMFDQILLRIIVACNTALSIWFYECFLKLTCLCDFRRS